jgi:hypothetical protein
MKNKIIIGSFLLLVSFAFGRYSASYMTSKSSSTTTSDTQIEDQSLTKIHTVIVTLEKPNGDKQTTEIIDDNTIKNDKKDEESTNKTQTEKTQGEGNTKYNLSVFAVTSVKKLEEPNYGLEVSKEILGPITMGVFGINNGQIGVSIGINF